MSDLFAPLQHALGDEYALERETTGTSLARAFIARENIFNRAVLVTVLSPGFAGALDFERFFASAERAAGLNHPGIVPAIALGTVEGLPYVITPYVPGVTLRARLLEQPPLTLEETVAILRDLLNALEYAHALGALHLGITPDRILISQKTGRLTDFGIEQGVADAQLTSTPAVARLAGDLGYRAPEQLVAGSSVDHRADLFAWGCAAYEMLTGMPAFVRRVREDATAPVFDDEPAPITLTRRDVPATFVRLVMRCLSASPQDRPSSATNILQVLQGVDVSERAIAERALTPAYVPVVTKQPTGAQAVQPEPTKAQASNLRRFAPLAGAVVLLAAIGGFLATREPKAKEIPVPTVVRPAMIDGSIVILPLAPTRGTSVDSAIGIGLSEEVARLSARAGVRVLGRMSAAGLHVRGLNPRAVARELGAAAVLTGTLSAQGDSLLVDLAVLGVDDGKVRWSAKFTRVAADVGSLERDMATGAVAAARGRTPSIADTSVSASLAADPATALLVLRASASLRALETAAALPLLEQAIARDPSSARAHSLLALTLAMASAPGGQAGEATRDRAVAAATRALGLDSTAAEAYAALAFVRLGRSANREAEAMFKRSLALDSTAALTWGWYGQLANHVGDFDTARSRIKRALMLEAGLPLFRTWEAQVLLSEKKPDLAEATARAVLAQDSTLFDAISVRADALMAMNRASDAVLQVARFANAGGQGQTTEARALLALARAQAGQVDAARELMLQMRDASGGTLPPLATLAATLAALGDVDSAVGLFERSARNHDAVLVAGVHGPRFEPFRKDPRGSAVLASVERW